MIKLLLVAVGLFLIWVLFASGFEKQRKILIALVATILCVLALWLESSLGKPRANVVNISDVSSCGVEAKHSYRTNFDLEICLTNKSERGVIKRIGLIIEASQCMASGECVLLQSMQRDLNVDIPEASRVTLHQNLSFGQVDPSANNIQWSVLVRSTKAVK